MKTKQITLEDIKDLAISIVDGLVNESVIKNCIDTDDEDEFIAQDIIVDALCRKFNIQND